LAENHETDGSNQDEYYKSEKKNNTQIEDTKFYNSMTDRSLKDSRLTTASQLAKSVKKKELKYISSNVRMNGGQTTR
jgi:hypothetical protein